jgi:hypothetical protein
MKRLLPRKPAQLITEDGKLVWVSSHANLRDRRQHHSRNIRGRKMKYVYIAIAVIVVIVGAFSTVKKVSPVAWGWWGATNTSSGVALKGYDPVAYFQASAPVQGRDEFSYAWNDAN